MLNDTYFSPDAWCSQALYGLQALYCSLRWYWMMPCIVYTWFFRTCVNDTKICSVRHTFATHVHDNMDLRSYTYIAPTEQNTELGTDGHLEVLISTFGNHTWLKLLFHKILRSYGALGVSIKHIDLVMQSGVDVVTVFLSVFWCKI